MDEIKIETGLQLVKEFEVKREHAARHVGSGEVEVLSTPSMIAFMERTALQCVEEHLPEGYTTVGFRVDVKHLKPAPIGAKIRVKVKLIEVDRRRLVFEVKAYWRNILIGEGIHERYVVDRNRFLSKVKSMIENR